MMLGKELYEKLSLLLDKEDVRDLETFMKENNEELMYQTVRLYLNHHNEELHDELSKSKRFSKLLHKQIKDLISYYTGIFDGIFMVFGILAESMMTNNDFERKMTAVFKKNRVKEILYCINENPDVQHKVLAESVGIRPNYLSQLLRELEQIGCVLRYAAGKRSFYELSIDGREFVENQIRQDGGGGWPQKIFEQTRLDKYYPQDNFKEEDNNKGNIISLDKYLMNPERLKG